MGEDTNIAAGNITVNLEHRTRTKHRTTIGRNVRTGVDNAFVAPVEIGDDAWIAAGSVITEDVPPVRWRSRARSRSTRKDAVESGTIEQTLPGLEAGIPSVEMKTGHAIPLAPKRLMVFAGRSHPELAAKMAERLGVKLRRDRADHLRERRDVLPLLRVHPRRRCLPRPDGLRTGRPELMELLLMIQAASSPRRSEWP